MIPAEGSTGPAINSKGWRQVWCHPFCLRPWWSGRNAQVQQPPAVETDICLR